MSEAQPMPSPPQPPPIIPLPHIALTEDDFRDPARAAALLNSHITNVNQILNQLQGVGGSPIPMRAHLDLQGNRVINVGPPSAPTDALTLGPATAAYGPAATSAALAPTGSNPMPGYRQMSNPIQQEQNSSVFNTLASMAPSASNSTITFSPPAGGYVSVTISAGILARADGSQQAYPLYTDSLPLPATYTLSSISRSAGGLVSGSTSVANTLVAGNPAVIAGVSDATFNGAYVLATAATPNFTYAQPGLGAATPSGGTVTTNGLYYYCLSPISGILFRRTPTYGGGDTEFNRLASQLDGSTLIAVVVVNGSGGDTVNSVAGATPPTSNIGAAPRLMITV
jgi:hypothetical protein